MNEEKKIFPNSSIPKINWENKLSRILEPIREHDHQRLRGVIERLKRSDGEGWAVGEMLERALIALS